MFWSSRWAFGSCHRAETNCPKPRSSDVTQRYTCLSRSPHAGRFAHSLVACIKWSPCGGTDMLGWLRAIVDWIFGRPSSLIQLSFRAPNTYGASRNRWEGPDPPKRPHDPDSPVRSPRRYGPTGRSTSVAVAEPVDDESLVAVGGPHSGSGRLVGYKSSDRFFALPCA